MIKATIQNAPYCTEMTFPCTETELLKSLSELGIDKERLAPTGMIIDIEPAELSTLLDCEVSLDALNYLGKRMDGMDHLEEKQFLAVLSCDELNMNWGLKNIINLTFNLPRYMLIEETDDLEKIGLTHMLNVRGALLESEYTNSEWLADEGMKLLDSGSGIDTEYGKIYVNEDISFEEVFNGVTFPGYYCEPNSVAAVEIGYFDLTELVELPCEDIAIKKALCRLGADSIKDCKILVDSTFDICNEWSEKISEVEKTKDLFGLNDLLKTEDIRIKQEQPTDSHSQFKKVINDASKFCSIFAKAAPLKADGLSGDYRCLAEFNGTVLAAKYSEKYGFEFVTWDRTFDGKSVCQGNYHTDYTTAKEDFATRSGLVDSDCLFEADELKSIHKCIGFALENDDSLDFEQEKELSELKERLENLIPTQTENQEQGFQGLAMQ
ncbi:MAG: hypothetical protein HDT47_00040 [Ruminococcaceae bacterium]|nr:hypothetical protein [Oscillospiraceae bacterium]